MNEMMKEMMRAKAFAKKDPEFYEEQKGLAHQLEWARRMKDAGRLTAAEFREAEADAAAKFIAAMPTEMFVQALRDGSLADWEAIASHDGTRDRHDVLKDRAALEKKIKSDVLDEFFAAGEIDAKRYNQWHRSIGTTDDEMHRRITDADDDGNHDDVAVDHLVGRLGSQETAPADMDTFADGLLRDLHGRSNGHVAPPPPAEEGAPKDVSED